MQKTEHYDLNLPDGDDYYDVQKFNENASSIDTLIYNVNQEILTMKSTFQAGVDSIYDACVDKGSTPASHALVDVVTAIENISGGGGADVYSMFPQEVAGYIYGGCACDYQGHLSDGDNVIVAHIIPLTNDSSITMNFSIYLETYYAGTVTFSLIIDNDTTIPNVASVTLTENEHKTVSFSYSFDTPLTPEYHIVALRANMSSGLYSVVIVLPLCNFYGSGFIGASYPGGYFVNGQFESYFTPNNFVVPTDPTVYELVSEYEPGGCIGIEDCADAMNNHFSNVFDSGTSFNIKGILGYLKETYNPDTEEYEYEYITPPITDTLTYTNGKFIYNHPAKRYFPDSGSSGVKEEHCFLLPITGRFFKEFSYINIHCKMISRSNIEYNSYLNIMLLERISSSQVDYSEYGSGIEGKDLEYYSEDEEFTISIDISDIDSNSINFVGIYFNNINTNSDPFTVEIDKIWGSNIDPTN